MKDYPPSHSLLFHTIINAAFLAHKFKQKHDTAEVLGKVEQAGFCAKIPTILKGKLMPQGGSVKPPPRHTASGLVAPIMVAIFCALEAKTSAICSKGFTSNRSWAGFKVIMLCGAIGLCGSHFKNPYS